MIIVDESGSMSVIRKQAFAGMNETLSTVRSIQDQYPDTEQRVTLVTFDSEHMKLHYDNAEAKQTENLKWQAYNPCAATPLYDTIGKSVSKLNAMVDKGDNVLVTIITDGYENSSMEWNHERVFQLVEELKKGNWLFTYIGANQDALAVAKGMGIDHSMNFEADMEGTKEMFRKEKKARSAFYTKLSECCEFSRLKSDKFFIDDEEPNK